MSALASLNGLGAVFLGETGTSDAGFLGAFVAEAKGNLNGFLPAAVAFSDAQLTAFNNRLIATYSPNVTGSPYTGQYGYRFQLTATTAFNRVGLYAAAGDLVQTVQLYNWSNIAAGPIATWTIDLTGLGVGVYGWINIPGGITLTAGVTYFLGRTVTSGNGQNWPDQKATTLNGAVGGSVFSCYLDGSNAPFTSTANFQYGGIDLNRFDSFGLLQQTQGQTLAGAATVADSGVHLDAVSPLGVMDVGASTVTVTITTTQSNTVLFVGLCTYANSPLSITDTMGLTYTPRYFGTNSIDDLALWQTIQPTAGTNVITIAMDGVNSNWCYAFAVAGANISAPFDPNGSLPSIDYGTSLLDAVHSTHYATTHAPDFVFGFNRGAGMATGIPTPTLMFNEPGGRFTGFYYKASAPQSATATSPTLTNYVLMDAVAEGAWTPAALPGLVAWYDVQDATTITVSGGFVTQLKDKGPNGYHAIQATAGAQPTLVSAAINGHPALNFDPSVTIQHLEATGLPPPLTLFPNGFALYFVSAEQDSGAYGYQVASPLHYSTYNVPEPFGRRDSLMFIGNGSDYQGGFDTYSVMTGNAPAYWGYRYTTAADTYEDWLNGTQVSTWVAGAYPAYYGGNSSDFQIGRRNSLDTVVTGYIGEIVVCNALVESDRLKLEAYLNAKWFGAPPTGVTGTLALTQASQTVSAVANISIGGTLNASQSQALSGLAKITVGGVLNVTQGNQTISASGGVTAGATLALTQAPHSLVATAKATVGGVLNASQSQTLVGAASTLVGGALNQTQAAQALNGLAKATVGAALNLSQATQTLSGAAGPVVKGALACTQPDQTIAASGALKVTGTLSATQQPQTLTGQGTAASPNCIGALQLTQADQTINGHATVAGTVGALSVTQADQTLGALARVAVGGALNAVQAAQTLSGAARANIGGTLTATQADQTIVGAAGTSILATLNQTQGNQTLVGRIDTTGGAILDKLQDSQILVGAAKLTVGASLDLTQASQTLTGLLSIAAGGALRITQDSQTFEGLANLAIAGRLVAYQQPQSLIAHDQPGTAIQTQSRVMVMA